MKATFKRALSGLLALALVLSLCYWGSAPAVSAAIADPTSPNVASGKSVAFYCAGEVSTDSNYGLNAVKAGLSVLTDGEAYSPNWWVNNGNPYVGLKSSVLTGPYVFSVDLGAEYVTEQLRVYSYGRPGWNVSPADAVTYSISANGSSWETLGTVALADAIVTTIEDPRYPGETVDIYAFALPVEATGRYVRASFNANSAGLFGIGEIEVYGEKAPELITSGASISYFGHGTEVGSDANWGSSAVNAGLSVLTDGVGNNPNWWVNNGNPNIGLKSSVLPGDYVFNLDIGTPSRVSRISSYFYSRTAWGVDAPDSVTYSVSSDGIIWKEMGSVSKSAATVTTLTDDRNPNDQAPSIYTFTLRFDAVDARYVKVSFGTNALGLIGLQEIQAYGVKKTITNLALGRPINDYQVTGGGTGYESTGTTKPGGGRYTVSEVENASLSRLTDGVIINASAVNYNGWTSGAWNSTGTIMSKYLQIYRNDSRIITMDLGAMRNITGIRMHFAALESLGFYMPTNVTYYLSEDGVNYYEVSDVWNYQATADANDKNISGSGPRHEWYSASGINFNARYVKLIFPVNVYILSDELQVYGSEVLSSTPTALESCPKYDPLENYVGHFANAAQTGGVRNEFMAYSGWYINSDSNEVYNTYKTVKEYMPAITYIDSNGVPQDWLFDDMTVMGHYYTARGTFNSYKAGYTEGKYYANQSDWYQWLCYAFGKDVNGNDLSYGGESVINLEALEEAARIAKETLNDPDYKVGVKLVLYPAVEYQENWGTIDGQKIDFTIAGAGSQEKALANRAKAYQWYVDQAVAMWEQAGFEHLELTGFYYYEETIHESTDRIAKAATQELTKIIHSHATPSTNTKPAFDSRVGGHLYIYQLPFYQSEGYWNWAEYGFDYALMQPNYSFYDMYTLTQLKECADLCTYYGLGMQMEFGGTASTTYHEKFMDYLTYGKEYGYQSAVVSWYMSTWGCYSMAYNSNNSRYLYDGVYEFVKGQTIPECEHSEHNVNGRCTNCAAEVEHTIVDGVCTGCGTELYIANGQCGDNVYWTLDATGSLVISGTGDMWDFGIYSNLPGWSGQTVTKVTVESGVTSIGICAFYRHIDITEVSLPDTLTEIRQQAFYYCEKLTQINLPDSLTVMGEHVFEYCTALTAIEIPESITVLPWATFSCCYALTDVTLPDTMTEIQGWAFSYCTSLTEIEIPASVNVLGEQVFRCCYYLNTVNIPEGVQVIPSNAFNGCERLSAITIPETVTLIDEHAFHNTGLQSVQIPGSVKEIKDNAFSYCDLLTSVTMASGLESIGGYVFYDCYAMESVTIPDTVTTIGSYAFAGCKAMTEILIPDSVTDLGAYALQDCTNLQSVTLSNSLTEIKKNTFYGAESLNNVIIPEGVTFIGEYAFTGCRALTDISFPSTLTTLNWCVFTDCDALTEFTIPDTVTSMGVEVFADCDALRKVTLSAGLTAIPDRTFYRAVSLTEVVIPTSITSIGVHAFDGCTALTSFAVPAQITFVGDYAFVDSGITELTFVGDAPTFQKNTLNDLTATAHYPAGNATWTADVLQNYGGTITWVSYCDHRYEAVITAPTCTTAGYTTYICATCGDSYVADGVAATGHSYEAVVTEPTCTTAGYTTYTCVSCGDSYVGNQVSALGHSYTWSVLYPATCMNTGLGRYTCSTCQDAYTEAIPAKGHSYVAAVTAPTCTEAGYTTYTCSNCSDNYTADVVSATGHAWSEGSCTTCGTVCAHSYDGSICTICGMERTEIVVATNTVTLTSGSTDQSETVTYTPDADGILTIHMFAANPGWGFQVVYPDGSSTLRTTGTAEATYEYEVTAGEIYQIIFTCYDKAGWSLGDGEISYEVTFKASDIGGDVVMEEYIVSDTQLYLGENAVTLEPNAYTTIFAFTPDETGTYKFTTADGILLGYWGSGSFFLTDATENKTNTLEYTVTSVGQSIMVGVSGGESCNILVEKTADYVEEVIDTIVYENTHEFGTYTFDQSALVAIDIFDTAADVAVLGADGFYHYGSANGPIMVVDLSTIAINISDAALNGQLTAYVTNTDGVTVKYDYNTAMMEYCDAGLYPVTAELAMMLQQIGADRGWYIAGGFLYPDATEVDQELGWMGICSYVSGTEVIVPTLTLKYPTLAFEDEILYNAYFTIDDATSIVEMGMITFSSRLTDGTIADALEVIPGYSSINDNYVVSSNGVPAKNLGDALYFKVYAKLSDGTYAYSDVGGFNAIAYARTILNNANSSAKAKALVVAMLNYGAAAQVYFDYNTENLMNASLTAEQLALVEEYNSSMTNPVVNADSSKVGIFTHNGGYTRIYPTVSFQGAFAINYYFTAKYTPDTAPTFYIWDSATYNSVDVLTPENATGTIDMVLDGTQWSGVIEGIAAKSVDETYYTAAVYYVGDTMYTSPVIAYSLGSYCKTVAESGEDFGAATAVYGYYAKAYFAK